MNLIIRRLTPADAEAYRVVRIEALTAHPDAFGSSATEEAALDIAAIRKRLADIDYYAAFDGNEYAALGGFVRSMSEKRRHKATIIGIYTRPAWQRRGIARALIETLLRDGRAAGITSFRLGVSETNPGARRLYERLGFTAYGREPRALIVGGRAIAEDLMTRDD
jgi:ribosomal protein S18 acetylase RimI-like enzyme